MLSQHTVQSTRFAQHSDDTGNAISNAISKSDTKQEEVSMLESDLFASGMFFSPGRAPKYSTKTKASGRPHTNNAPLPASDETKAQAMHLVNGFIEQEVKKVTDVNKIVPHQERLKAAREASDSQYGVMLSNRLIEKYHAKWRISVLTIVDLGEILLEIDESEFVQNYADKAAAIVKRNHSLQDPSTRSALISPQDSVIPKQEPKQELMQDPSAVALKTPLGTRDAKQELRDFIQQGTSAALAPPIPLKMRVGARTA
jgi:hypothetical protein